MGVYHYTWLDYFNRILLHKFIFPSTRYSVVGFTEENGAFAAITRQPFTTFEKGASRKITEEYLLQQGFKRIKNDDYYNASSGVILEDLHDENIFEDGVGNILFIDPVIYFETKDMDLRGQHIFSFPFK